MTHSVHTCGQFDSDDCLDWSAATACGAGRTCQGGACVTTCTDACDAGEVGCADTDTRWSCTDANGDGCLEQSPSDCAAGQTCAAGVCGSGCQDDGMEENDASALAYELDEGLVSGDICPDDVDWYWLVLPGGQSLRVTMSFDGDAADLDLELFLDPELQVPVDVSAGISDSETVIAASAQTDRLFYVRASGYDGAAGPYDLDVQFLGAQECVDDGLEENDSRGAPMYILNGDYPGLQLCLDDEDWYENYMFVGETLSADIAFANAQGDIDLQLTDEGGAELDSSTSVADGEAVSHAIEVEGYYYIRVYGGVAGVQNGYDMTVGYGGGGCADDGYEPNDDAFEAPVMSAGTVNDLQLCSNDEDWFAIYVTGGALMGSIDFSNASGDLDLALLDDYNTVLDYSYSTGNGETVGVEGLATGWYYLRVTGYQGAANAYTLEIVD